MEKLVYERREKIKMRKQNSGITLIALVITIIVILILAGVTIATLTGESSIIFKGQEANFKTDIATFQEDLRVSIYNDYIERNGQRKEEDKFTTSEYIEIKKIIPSFKEKYKNKIAIKEDELIYIGLDDKERKWIEEAKIVVAPKLTVNYVDESGKKLAETYTTTVADYSYSIKSPEIDGYKTLYDILEGEISEDKEINIEYYPEYYDLVFTGLNSNGEVTNNESEIVSYMVGDGTDTPGNGVGNFSGKRLVIPDVYNGKKVTKINKFSFNGNSNIETLILPDTIESINDRCFQYCLNLKEVNMPSGIIGGLSFYGCENLNKIILGNNVTKIQASAFYNCKNLSYLMIRCKNIELEHYGNFQDCFNLKEIKVSKDNNSYKVIDGVLYTKDEKKIVIYPVGKESEEYIVPDTVEEIGLAAFSYAKNLKKVEVPTTVNSVKSRAFEGCLNLEEAYIGGKELGVQSFNGCSNLKKVVLGNQITNLDSVCFANCSKLNEFIVESKEFNIKGYRNFDGCSNLKEIKIGENNNSYKVIDGVLYTKDETKIILYPVGKEGEEYTLPNTVTEIGFAAFHDANNLIRAKISSPVKTINSRAFEDCRNLQEVEVNSEKINLQAFYNCGNLKKVKLGNMVSEISHAAFGNCNNLTQLEYDGTIENWNNINKNVNWKTGSNNLNTITCTDGTINL